MSDTPRTDAVYFQNATAYDMAGLSKQLERELAAANTKIAELESKPCGLFAKDMSLRYWLAGMAMQGLLASGHFTTPANEEEGQAWMTRHQDPWDDETGEKLEFPVMKFDFPEAAFCCADSMLEYGKVGA
jgi:hypothetical protein